MSALVQSVLFLLQLLVAAPAALCGLVAALGGGSGWDWASLVVGLLLGVLVLQLGLAVGGRAFERRGPELLTSALRA